ncbi:unnamed protein product [Prunus armeniaca]|uniref:Uncharacterized protein n=1 Tax=Prunus armeniaca TaxID=36596 RepID=A0A6J5Y2G3_PRUAR|nr:unnamed protein product [Prunus armeniaca]CAB4319611.1 unnamed protein product [Prunus armeniaca]
MQTGLGTEKYSWAWSLLLPGKLEEILENLGRIFEWELQPKSWSFHGRAALEVAAGFLFEWGRNWNVAVRFAGPCSNVAGGLKVDELVKLGSQYLNFFAAGAFVGLQNWG